MFEDTGFRHSKDMKDDPKRKVGVIRGG